MLWSSTYTNSASMSFLDTLRQWDEAANCAERQDLSEALRIFLSIQEPNSKICFNIGCLHLLNQDLDAAEKVRPTFFSETQPLTLYKWYFTHIKSKSCLDVDDKANVSHIYILKVQVTQKGEVAWTISLFF